MATDAEQQARIIAEVGDPNGSLAVAIASLWKLNNDRGSLQFLYTKREALDVRLREEAATVDVTLGGGIAMQKLSQLFDHLQLMRANVQDAITRAEAVVSASRPSVGGKLTTETPLRPDFPDSPDASDPVYSGSPYRRRIRRII